MANRWTAFTCVVALSLIIGCGGTAEKKKPKSSGGDTKKADGGGKKKDDGSGGKKDEKSKGKKDEKSKGKKDDKGKKTSGVDAVPKNILAFQGDKATSRGGQKPHDSDTLVRSYPDDPDTLNLVIGSDNVSTVFQRFVYDYLARPNGADPTKYEPELAESWTFNKETLTYTLNIRKGVKWHPMKLPNGKDLPQKEVTARDVKFTFDCIMNPHVNAGALRSYFMMKDDEGKEKPRISVKVRGKYKVVIKWNEPYFMADDFTLGRQIMPRHVYGVDEKGEPISFDFSSKEFADGLNNHWANTKMCGTGPLIFKEYKKSEQAVLVRNPDYYGKPFFFKKVIFQYNSNPNTVVQKMLANEIDFAGITQRDQYVKLKKEHKAVTSGKVKMFDYRVTAYPYLGYNLRRPYFKDREARVGLSHGVPVQQIIDKIYHGLAFRQTGPFLPGSKWEHPDVKPIPYDLEKAKQFLDKAGWKDTNKDGTRDKVVEGKKVEFKFNLMIYSGSPTYQQIAEIIKNEFTKLGIGVQINPTKWELMLQKLRKKDYDATILGWVSDYKSDPFQIWHGSQADIPESSNSGSYKNEEVDKLITKLRVTLEEKDQIPIYREIHRLIAEDQPYTFLYLDKACVGIDARLANFKEYPMLRPHYDTREWYSTRAR